MIFHTLLEVPVSTAVREAELVVSLAASRKMCWPAFSPQCCREYRMFPCDLCTRGKVVSAAVVPPPVAALLPWK